MNERFARPLHHSQASFRLIRRVTLLAQSLDCLLLLSDMLILPGNIALGAVELVS